MKKKVVLFHLDSEYDWVLDGERIIDAETPSAFHLQGSLGGRWCDKSRYKYEEINEYE